MNGETAYVPGKGILIQPNPVDKFVRIVLSREVLETEPEHLTVTNQAGIVVHQIKINPQAFWVEMDVADLPDGMYICQLTSSKGRPIAQKLIVQH